jgi:hypothetical protein
MPSTSNIATCTRSSREGCFAPGTLVRTPTGLFPIERLTVGDEVISRDGIARIAKAHHATTRELVRVWSTDRKSVVATPWHRFFDVHGDLVQAENLRSQTVAARDGTMPVIRVDRITYDAPVSVYNLSLDRSVSFYANGMLVEAPHAARVLGGHSLLLRRAG